MSQEKPEGISPLIIVMGISITGCIVAILLAVMDFIGAMVLPMEWIDYVIFGTLFIFGPYGFYSGKQLKRIRQIESHLPDFLRDVAEAGRFGMTLADAIVVASNGRYGRLTPEIRKMAAQIDWGIPATEALRLFSERVNTQLVNRVVAIVIKSSDAGGDVADVLTMVSRDAKEAQLMMEERRIQMSTYLMVIYIAFFVFLVTIIIMNATFLPKMKEAGESLKESQTEGMEMDLVQTEALDTISFLFLLAALVHAGGDGLIAGTIMEGKVVTGMKHSFIMLIVAFVMLRVM